MKEYMKEFLIVIVSMIFFIILGTTLILIDELVLKTDKVLIGVGSSIITFGLSNFIYKLFYDVKNNKQVENEKNK